MTSKHGVLQRHKPHNGLVAELVIMPTLVDNALVADVVENSPGVVRPGFQGLANKGELDATLEARLPVA
jgi:hypothetical protein